MGKRGKNPLQSENAREKSLRCLHETLFIV